MLNILLSGANGRLGRTLAGDIAASGDTRVAVGVDVAPETVKSGFPVYASFSDVREEADIVIDFSRPGALRDLLEFAAKRNIGAVLATTGYTDTDKVVIAKYAGHIPLFFSANMSLGVNLQMELVKRAAGALAGYDVEIIEKHHNRKADSPSGTALALADALNASLGGGRELVYGRHAPDKRRGTGEIGVHAVRGGTVVGEHDVLFLGPDEVIEINHRALSMQVFAQGALRAARFLRGKRPALYSMSDLLAEIFDKI
jgi:4-hydroxy-tetrahydrodipicolinate reductase